MKLTDDQERQLRALLKVFLEENAKLNLSALRDEESCWVGNVLDSIVGIRNQESGIRGKVLEVGMGGGFPILPLAILFPQTQFVGMDATKKKVDAVGRIVEELGLKNVKLITGRAEELGHDAKLREQFDVVVARAVAPFNTLLEYMSPFTRPPSASGQAKVGGQLICWKSFHIEDELQESVNARMQLHCRLMEKREYELPGDFGKRQLLIFQKTGILSSDFPREVGMPKKEPL